jgi:hypothetical protein
MKIKLVVATRVSEETFFQQTAMGRSLLTRKPSLFELRLFANNTRGLPSVYNEVIQECASDPATLVFAHDDVHLLDFFWCQRVQEGLAHFDIIGLAGNKRRVPQQPSWAFINTQFTWDTRDHLSGVVGHGKGFPPSNLSYFGPPRQRVKLLDGLFLAAQSTTLIQHNLFFDEDFLFHFYDLDFCRQAEEKSLSCGTWDLSVIHESGGNFGSLTWRKAYQHYLTKWSE